MEATQAFHKNFPQFSWDYTREQIRERAENAMKRANDCIDMILKISDGDLTFDSAITPTALDDTDFGIDQNILTIVSQTSVDKDLRDEATEALKKLSDCSIQIEMRVDLYELVKKVREKHSELPHESERYLNKILLYKKRNGLHLDKEHRDKLEEMLKIMNNMCIDYEKNISEECTVLKFKYNELNGMPEDFINSLEKEGDFYKVTLKYPHVNPISKHCKVVSTRKQVSKAFSSRCIETNVAILEKLVTMRHQKARMLGYDTHADFVTEILMSKNKTNVSEFLSSLYEKIKDSSLKERARLLELKEKECKENNWEFDGKINTYDMGYYQRMVEEIDYKVDQNLVKEYFPFEFVTEKLLEIYQTLLSLSFTKLEGAKVWHPEVTLYMVHCSITSKLLGYFYLDLFPRDGKFSHAACFSIQPACLTKDGYIPAISAMIANFAKPTPDKPSLLTFDEVETYFHEFGHVMHQICSKTQYSLFHGTSVETDFVEAPSQMLENWVWERKALKKISSHYKTKEPLDDDLVQLLIKSRKANISLIYMRQLALATFDHIIHTREKVDTLSIITECWEKFMGYEPLPGTNFSAAFGHMAGGYDARYYGYLWSQVFSSDMFVTRFKKEGIFNPKTGLDYREKILYPGHTRDASDLLKDFLGREPIQEPFLQLAGILPEP